MGLESIVQVLREKQVHDYLGLRDDHSLSESIGNETILFSDLAGKFNKYNITQERVLVVTEKAIFNFAKKKMTRPRRRIPIESLRSLVFSSESSQVVLQVKNDYDYRYTLVHRRDICEIVAKAFKSVTGGDLPIYVKAEKSLKTFASTKRDFSSLDDDARSRKISVESIDDPLDYLTKSPSGKSLKKHDSQDSNLGTMRIQQTSRQQSTVSKEGWLSKRKQKGNIWKLKFFVIDGTNLTYFHPRLKGIVELGPGTTYTQSLLKQDNIKVQLKVTTSSRRRPLVIGSEDQETMERWKSAFSGTSVQTEGWLWKQDPWKKTWTRRFFVVRKKQCWWFEMYLRWAIPLDESDLVVRPAKLIEPTLAPYDEELCLKNRSGFAFRFSITSDEKVYLFSSDTEQSMLEWIQAIQTAKNTVNSSSKRSSELTLRTVDLSKFTKAPSREVALVFTDIQGSTNLWENVSDAMNDALELHDDILREHLKSCKGYEVKTEGDAFMVAFFNAVDAIQWCVNVQKALLEAPWSDEIIKASAGEENGDLFKGLCIRMGIHVGRPTCKKNPVTFRMDYFGQDVNLAARISDAAHGGQITCSLQVKREFDLAIQQKRWRSSAVPLIEEIPGPFMLKGIDEPQQIFQVLASDLEGRKSVFPPLRAQRVGSSSYLKVVSESEAEDQYIDSEDTGIPAISEE